MTLTSTWPPLNTRVSTSSGYPAGTTSSGPVLRGWSLILPSASATTLQVSERQTDRQTDRDRDRYRDRETETDRQKQREGDRERQTERGEEGRGVGRREDTFDI